MHTCDVCFVFRIHSIICYNVSSQQITFTHTFLGAAQIGLIVFQTTRTMLSSNAFFQHNYFFNKFFRHFFLTIATIFEAIFHTFITYSYSGKNAEEH